MEKEAGSIVPGKLANLTILADNPVTIDPVKLKDIRVWGTVQEGRVLPVKPALGGGSATLGPAIGGPAFAAAAEADRHDHGPDGDSCTLARHLATLITGADAN